MNVGKLSGQNFHWFFFFIFRTVELPWGDKDQQGDCTLHQGDVVSFNIATDRRDKLQRATNITLLEESFIKLGEKRETVKDHFVLITID